MRVRNTQTTAAVMTTANSIGPMDLEELADDTKGGTDGVANDSHDV